MSTRGSARTAKELHGRTYDPTLRLYAIMRGDLQMPTGKLAAQAGHAFLGAFLEASRRGTPAGDQYGELDPGTKIVLIAPDEAELRWAAEEAERLGIPHALITDRNHILPPHFTGEPIITALGLGPATREEARSITRSFALAP